MSDKHSGSMARVLAALLTAALLYSIDSPAAEIWLLSGPDCNICTLYERVEAKRGYGDRLVVDGESVAILRADKQALPPMLAEHFDTVARQDADWPIQLTVAVVDDGHVLYEANIAESVDWSEGRIAERYMNPPATEIEDALHDYGFDYSEYFLDQIHLEYFLRRARGTIELPYKAGDIQVVPSPQMANDKKVSIWGSALQPAHNGLFISTRITQLIERIGRERLFLTYTNGSDTLRRDTLVLEGGAYRFESSKLAADFPGNFSGVDDWFSHLASSSSTEHLIVHVGHYGPTGMPVWGHALTLSPEAIGSALEQTGKQTVLVSGGCHSGLLAGAAQCGFFAAHPDVIATGCQRSFEAIETSDDYLKYFFLGDGGSQDTGNDGTISFGEAHWYAATRVERHNIVYSDSDRTVDRYFDAHAASVPARLTLEQLTPLVERLGVAERAAFAALSTGLDATQVIDLHDHVDRNRQALELIGGITETSSAVRNAGTELPYPLSLVMLARRAVYLDRGQQFDPVLTACENRPISAFLAEP